MSEKMHRTEWRSIISLSAIMALRMLGLFIVLPVFSLYATQLYGATPLLVGLALGIYGLFQAIFQIPMGILSDRYGRKSIIAIGLIVFAVGSLIAAFTQSIFWMIIGRSLQGMAAIGGTLLAMIADLTRETKRTQAMAVAGITIGVSFSIAMFLGPMLSRWLNVGDLFILACCFAALAIVILYSAVPTPPPFAHKNRPLLKDFFSILCMPELIKLNLGIFLLHLLFTASFIAIPLTLNSYVDVKSQWQFYLPTFFSAFFICLLLIRSAEQKKQTKVFFLMGIALLYIAYLNLYAANGHRLFAYIGLGLFFTGFSLLESLLPSLVSRTAPIHAKGTALGLYACTQFSGIFVGGIIGGFIYGNFHLTDIYLFCAMLSLIWFIFAFISPPPRYLTTQIFKVSPSHQQHWDHLKKQLQTIPGVHETTYIPENATAFVKMEPEVLSHQHFLAIKQEAFEGQ